MEYKIKVTQLIKAASRAVDYLDTYTQEDDGTLTPQAQTVKTAINRAIQQLLDTREN